MTYKYSINNKAQASLEYMSIFGIGFLLVALAGGAFFAYTNSAKASLDQDQINKIGTELLDDIQKIYFFGDTNRRTYKTTFPQGVQGISIHHINQSGDNYYYFNFTIIADGEYRDLIFQTDEDYIDIKCVNTCVTANIAVGYNISTYDESYLGQGFKNIRIEALNNSVYVEFIE
jgi:hypothetical protein